MIKAEKQRSRSARSALADLAQGGGPARRLKSSCRTRKEKKKGGREARASKAQTKKMRYLSTALEFSARIPQEEREAKAPWSQGGGKKKGKERLLSHDQRFAEEGKTIRSQQPLIGEKGGKEGRGFDAGTTMVPSRLEPVERSKRQSERIDYPAGGGGRERATFLCPLTVCPEKKNEASKDFLAFLSSVGDERGCSALSRKREREAFGARLDHQSGTRGKPFTRVVALNASEKRVGGCFLLQRRKKGGIFISVDPRRGKG